MHLQQRPKTASGSKSADASSNVTKLSTRREHTKDTFVEDMLYHIADTLASDAEFGYNNANMIRDRVEDIAEDMKESKSASRAVLESRFALGKDDAQYLSQAVSVLWAGDGGERLRVLPPGQVPSILRHASANGVVRAMRSVMGEKIQESKRALSDALSLVAWMMQTTTIRVAVIDYVELSELEDVRKVATLLKNAYESSGAEAATDYVLGLLNDADDDSSGTRRATVQALLDAVYMLTDPTGSPHLMFQDVINASRNLVKRTARDVYLVAELQSIVGEPSKSNSLKSRTKKDDSGLAEKEKIAKCRIEYDEYGRVKKIEPNMEPVTIDQVMAATNVAFVSMQGERIASDQPTDDKWKVTRVVSPFFNQGKLGDDNDQKMRWNAVMKTNPKTGKTQTVSDIADRMNRCVRRVYTTGAADDVRINPRILEGRLESQLNLDDTFYIDYCMIRGNCGWKGPHQQNLVQEKDLPYEYPQYPMRNYTAGKYSNVESVETISQEAHMRVGNVAHAHYVEPYERERVKYDTDPYPRVFNKLNALYASEGISEIEKNESGFERVRTVEWAPIPQDDGYSEITFDTKHNSTCEASVYEFVLRSQELQAGEVKRDKDDINQQRRARCLRAAAACAKIHQLMPMTNVKQFSMNSSETPNSDVTHTTRPARHCAVSKATQPYEAQRVVMPYDCGIARFKWTGNKEDLVRSPPSIQDKPTNVNVNDENLKKVSKDSNSVTRWLRQGVEDGWKDAPATLAATALSATAKSAAKRAPQNANFSLYAEPARRPLNADVNEDPTNNRWVETDDHYHEESMVPDDLYSINIHDAIVRGLNALEALEQMSREQQYIDKLSTKDSAERVGVFGVHGEKTVENATLDRRSSVWSDALREVNVSGDRLYRFVTHLTGSIGESADAAISWEDEDLKQVSKDALARQKSLSERVSRFQTKLVESVLSSTLRSSKLQLDLRKSSANAQELVVLSSDIKDSIQKIADGEAGHGFFEAQVDLNDALGKYSKPMSIKDIVSELQSVSVAFHDQVAASLAPSSGASYSRVVEPRNSFMLHLKPDTLAAIQKAYDHITSELERCDGYHRKIHLWEFVEGKDWVLVTRFAELVGLMLQNTRMRSGSFAAYVGMSQQIANGHNIRMQIQRLRNQACHYLVLQSDEPMWLHPNGRTWYFGGSVGAVLKHPGDDRNKKRKCRNDAKDDDDYGSCIGRQRPRVERTPTRTSIFREVNRKSAWKEAKMDSTPKDSGKPSQGSQLNAIYIKLMEKLFELFKKLVARRGLTGAAQRFDQARQNCEEDFKSDILVIERWLCNELQNDYDPVNPNPATNQKSNPYKNCERKGESGAPCLPSDVGEEVMHNNVRCHAVKIDVTKKDFATQFGADPPQVGQPLSPYHVEVVHTALNNFFRMQAERNVVNNLNPNVGWKPHTDWMQPHDNGAGGIEYHVVNTESRFKNVWVKAVNDEDFTFAAETGQISNLVQTIALTVKQRPKLVFLTAITMAAAYNAKMLGEMFEVIKAKLDHGKMVAYMQISTFLDAIASKQYHRQRQEQQADNRVTEMFEAFEKKRGALEKEVQEKRENDLQKFRNLLRQQCGVDNPGQIAYGLAESEVAKTLPPVPQSAVTQYGITNRQLCVLATVGLYVNRNAPLNAQALDINSAKLENVMGLLPGPDGQQPGTGPGALTPYQGPPLLSTLIAPGQGISFPIDAVDMVDPARALPLREQVRDLEGLFTNLGIGLSNLENAKVEQILEDIDRGTRARYVPKISPWLGQVSTNLFPNQSSVTSIPTMQALFILVANQAALITTPGYVEYVIDKKNELEGVSEGTINPRMALSLQKAEYEANVAKMNEQSLLGRFFDVEGADELKSQAEKITFYSALIARIERLSKDLDFDDDTKNKFSPSVLAASVTSMNSIVGPLVGAVYTFRNESSDAEILGEKVMRAFSEYQNRMLGALAAANVREKEELSELIGQGNSKEANAIRKMLGDLTRMSPNEIADDKEFVDQIAELFKMREDGVSFIQGRFVKFMELMLRKIAQNVQSCIERDDDECKKMIAQAVDLYGEGLNEEAQENINDPMRLQLE